MSELGTGESRNPCTLFCGLVASATPGQVSGVHQHVPGSLRPAEPEVLHLVVVGLGELAEQQRVVAEIAVIDVTGGRHLVEHQPALAALPRASP